MTTISFTDNLRQNTATSSPTQKPVAWEKYEGGDIFFEYPSNMNILETPLYGADITVMFSSVDVSISEEMRPRIQIYKVDTPVDEVYLAANESRNKDQFPEFSEIEIDGKKMYQTKALDPEVIFTHTIFGDENKSYLIEMFSSEVENDQLQNAYQHVVETFNL